MSAILGRFAIEAHAAAPVSVDVTMKNAWWTHREFSVRKTPLAVPAPRTHVAAYDSAAPPTSGAASR
ncbi:hypothetical protein [Paramicrobacterium agarici]|uniref:hypothetical protein n=1 Tax=Paramicrobacterium agarici TaxID=630514 RepID=UPI00114F54C3|nr:hypothetical protein [Microbacterium agarici]